jgi:hypothetical protein
MKIHRVVNVSGLISDGARGDGPLNGPASQWIEKLAGWAVDLGLDAFVFWPPDTGTAQVERFAIEVAPEVRRAVELRR